MELVSAGDNCGSDQRKYRIQQQAGAGRLIRQARNQSTPIVPYPMK